MSFLRLLVLIAGWGLWACGQDRQPEQLEPKGWFVGVVTLPTAADALSEERILIDWVIQGQSSQTSALHIARQDQLAQRSKKTSFSPGQHRYALNVARAAHEQQKALWAKSSLLPFPRQASHQGLCNNACNDQSICQNGNCVQQIQLNTSHQGVGSQQTVTLQVVGVNRSGPSPISMLIGDDLDTPEHRESLQQAVEQFAQLMAQELALFGVSSHGSPIDVDGDGRLTVAMTNAPEIYNGTGAVAIVRPADLISPHDLPDLANGNHRDILWLTLPTEQTEYRLVANLTHEYVHLLNATLRIEQRNELAEAETLWLDEGMAHLCEDLMGYGKTTIPLLQEAYNQWSDAMFASTEDNNRTRAAAYLLLRYILDVQASASGSQLVGDSIYMAQAQQVITQLVQEPRSGFLHQLFVDFSSDGGKRYLDWVIQMVMINNPDFQDVMTDIPAFLPSQSLDLGQRSIGLPIRGVAELVDGSSIDLALVIDKATSVDSFYLTEVAPSSTPVFWLPELDGQTVELIGPDQTTGPRPILHRKSLMKRMTQ